jgi:tight adherence protein B
MDLAALGPGAIAALGVGLVFAFFATRRATPRLEDELHELSVAQEPKRSLPLREQVSAALGRGAKPLLRGKRGSNLQAKLDGAGLSLKPHEFLVLQLACVAIVGAAAWFRFNSFPIAAAAGFAGYFIPSIWVRRRDLKHRRKMDSQLADMIGMLANSLRAGFSIQQAVASVAEAKREPISGEMRRVARETALGIELTVALAHLNQRLQSKDFDILMTAISIHRRVGGNLAEVMDKISAVIRERVRLAGEIRTLTAQARASGYIVTALPFAVGGILSLISPGYEMPLFQSPVGWALIAIGMIMIGTGYGIIRKITNIAQ